MLTCGEMAEWSNAPDSKSGIRLVRIEGSNPSLSASCNFGLPKGGLNFLRLRRNCLKNKTFLDFQFIQSLGAVC